MELAGEMFCNSGISLMYIHPTYVRTSAYLSDQLLPSPALLFLLLSVWDWALKSHNLQAIVGPLL